MASVIGLWIYCHSGLNPSQGYCVMFLFGQDTPLSQCLSPPRTINEYWTINCWSSIPYATTPIDTDRPLVSHLPQTQKITFLLDNKVVVA